MDVAARRGRCVMVCGGSGTVGCVVGMLVMHVLGKVEWSGRMCDWCVSDWGRSESVNGDVILRSVQVGGPVAVITLCSAQES